MSKQAMSLDDALAALGAVKAAMHEQYPDHEARLGQLDAALDTASMAVQHLADEEAREVELARRLVRREKVHGDNEVVDPHGRPFENVLQRAGMGGE